MLVNIIINKLYIKFLTGGSIKNYPFIFFIALLVFGTPAFPQTFGIGGGLSTVQGPDEYTNDINSAGLGFSSGFNIGAKLKFSIPQFPITSVGSIMYSRFSSNQSTSFGYLKVSQSVWTIFAGGEYKLIPASLSPYISAELGYSDFGEPEVEGYYPYLHPIPVKSEYGIGLALGVGAELTILPSIGLDTGIKFNFFDLVGKKWEKEPLSVLSYI